jgi:glycosyltransferase involved in cell wall biosynthesis
MSFAIVIPAHDEEHRIDRTLRAYRAGFPQPDVTFHVALDGCRDLTAEVVERHALADPRVVLHDFPKLGKGGVLMETFRRCDADLIGFVDADCATPPAELARMTEAAANVDGVIASRRLPASVTPGHRGAARSLTSSGFAWLVRRMFRLPYADTQCGAKVLHRRLVERVVPLMSSRDFLFDVDLLVAARRTGFNVVEVPTVWIDQSGSKLTARRDAVRMLIGAARLWFHHRTLPIDALAIGTLPVDVLPVDVRSTDLTAFDPGRNVAAPTDTPTDTLTDTLTDDRYAHASAA